MRLSLLAGLLLVIACGCRAQPDPPPVSTGPTISVDPRHGLGPVNRLVLGHNIEAGNGKDIFSSKTDTSDPRAGKGAWDVANHRPLADTVRWSQAIGMSMLRYPGGCLTHNFDWKQAVGPQAERTYFTFGIDEWLTFCQTVGAEPLMNVSELAAPADAAALVEYLNAPADAAHPWAMKRAAWGHPEPWGVRRFELANESDHGNHDVQPRLKRTAGEYADWVVASAAAMRAVDPAIRIGAHAGTGTPASDPWNTILLQRAGTAIDWFAVHLYGPCGRPTDSAERAERAHLAAADASLAHLRSYHALIREKLGHDLPIGVTEYNGSNHQYRFAFAAALHSADFLGRMLQPAEGVEMAHYWQFMNGYFGFLRGPDVPQAEQVWKTTAAADLFVMWQHHLGANLVAASASGIARVEFAGVRTSLPMHGEVALPERVIEHLPLPVAAISTAGITVEAVGPGALRITFTELSGKRYVDLPAFASRPGHAYRLRWEQRLSRLEGDASGFSPGFGLCDARGWKGYESACAGSGPANIGDWTAVGADLVTLPDASGLHPVIRLENGSAPISGVLEIRNAALTVVDRGSLPGYLPLTTTATLSADGRTLHLVVFNKHPEQDLRTTVQVADGSAKAAHAWCLSGPMDATTVHESLGGRAVDGVTGSGFAWTFPARSMTAIDIER
jgi:alpha-L-arabinofuranosidase